MQWRWLRAQRHSYGWRIGQVPGDDSYGYSPGLEGATRRWTVENLDKGQSDPAKFLPG